MVGMGCIVVGGQNGREQAAGAVAGFAEEAGGGAVTAPVPGDGDRAAVGERETEDVEGVGGGMLAEAAFGAAVEPAAAVAAGMEDGGDRGSEMLGRGRLDYVTLPQSQRRGDRAAGNGAGRPEPDRAVILGLKPHAVDIAAARPGAARRRWAVGVANVGKQLRAPPSVAVERRQLDPSGEADRIVEVEPGPGEVLPVQRDIGCRLNSE